MLVSTHYMDEAERCDRIVYILNGNLVARGTVAEVIAEAGLHTYVIHGDGVRRLSAELRAGPASNMSPSSARPCMSAAATRLRSSARSNPIAASPAFTIDEAEPSLEDVFIHLQEQTQ